jgi:hypothetical protein
MLYGSCDRTGEHEQDADLWVLTTVPGTGIDQTGKP